MGLLDWGLRSEWWRRCQWALELALGDDPATQQTGIEFLSALAESPLATPSEVGIIEVFTFERGAR